MASISTRTRPISIPPDIRSSAQSSAPSLREIIARKGSRRKSAGERQKQDMILIGEQTILRLPKVKALTGLSKSTLYELMQQKSFPSSILLGRRTVGWLKSEVDQWISERTQASRQVRTIGWSPSSSSRR
jgi:prophage regulatory protein